MENQILFDKYDQGKHWHNHPLNYSKRFAEFLKKNDFQGILIDAGCGNGRDTNLFQKEGFKVIGIDISDEVLNSARENFPLDKFEKNDLENLSFKDESISAIFMINVIHYLKKEKAIEEIHRTLEKGGYLFLHFNLSIVDAEDRVDYLENYDDIKALFAKFEIIEEKRIERIDDFPIKHYHHILELILRKK